jgi:type VI protein secretion system component VasF
LDQQMAKEKAMKQAQKEAKEYLRLKHENFLKKEAEKLKAMKEREEAENAANTYRTEMTARETEERRKRRQYRQELDAQVELKYAGNSSKSHLSPTERGMNRRMLANMVNNFLFFSFSLFLFFSFSLFLFFSFSLFLTSSRCVFFSSLFLPVGKNGSFAS